VDLSGSATLWIPAGWELAPMRWIRRHTLSRDNRYRERSDVSGSGKRKMGTGQNDLQYAIQLAQSQITSFFGGSVEYPGRGHRNGSGKPDQGAGSAQSSVAALAQAMRLPNRC